MPRYLEIAEIIRGEIDAGTWGLGEYLPPESKLAQRFEVAPGTVRQALKELVAEGTLSARRGAKKIVMREPRQTKDVPEFRSFAQWALSEKRKPSGLVIESGWVEASEVDLRKLNLSRGEKVFRVLRLRTIDDQPVMVERTHYPPAVGVQVETLPADATSVTNELKVRFGIEFVAAENSFTTAAAGDVDQRLLKVAEGYPLLCHLRTSRDRFGTPLEWSEDRYRAGVVALSVPTVQGDNLLNWDRVDNLDWMN
ncbi:GntR family transcriptional regulator [Corynebacterium casei]|uniref:GntR family transcriptional regulator n=1 Tax=Corynebacterium casei TaxID=160386 RepID=UPI003F93A700